MDVILLADPHAITRSALALLLRTRLEFSDILAASNWRELLAAAEPCRPRIILLDWDLPGFTPQRDLPALRQRCPQTVVIALSARPEAHLAAQAFEVDAFVSKLDSPDRLMETIQTLRAKSLSR